MSLYSKIGRRLLQGIPVLFGLSVLIFFITRVLPGNPVRLALGPSASDEEVAQFRQELGLDEPLPVQYVDWLVGVFQGEWGTSIRTGNNVFNDILARFPATFELVVYSLAVGVLVAVPLGVIAATYKDELPDQVSRLGALFGVSMPRFWVAIVLQVLVVGWLDLLPLTGRIPDGVAPPPAITHLYTIDSLLAGQWATFVDVVQHLILPVTALSLATIAQVMRLVRSEMLEEQNKDYTTAASAYGLPNDLLRYKYMLKNSLSSSLTLVGLEFGFLIGNAFLVELVFSWPGLATYGVESILFQDFNAVVGVTMAVGVTYLFANLVVDILYGYLDPRVGHEEADT